METLVLRSCDVDAWHAILEAMPQSDIYFLPEYHQVHEVLGDGEPLAFVAREGEAILFLPSMVRPVEAFADTHEDGYKDMESVYGYSGPLSTTQDRGFLSRAWGAFLGWAKEQRVVAQFVRFHPVLGNHRLGEGCLTIQEDRETVLLDLRAPGLDLWKGYPSVHRNMIRKAVSRRLLCRETPLEEGLRGFKRLYENTMVRVGAAPYYRFSEAYFEALWACLKGRLVLFSVWDGDILAASALFLTHGPGMHYHLAASDEAYGNAAPNNLLLHEAALWGRERGIHWMHLGGGRTPSREDGLFRFKARVSRTRLPYCTGRLVHDPSTYRKLCDHWMARQGTTAPPSYFLLYRLG